MAQERIEITFKPKGDKAMILAIKQLDVVTRRLTGTTSVYEKELKELRLAQEKYTAAGIMGTKTLRIQSNAFATLRSKMLLASFGMGIFGATIVETTKKFADLQDLQRGFDNLGRSINSSSEFLDKLRKATNGTVDDMELMKQANNAMMLGIVKSEDEMANLFDAAQRMGQALGKDTVSSIESLVTGMGRQSRLMLDNLGIIVKTEEAYINYARANNLSADSLTDFQKKQAFNQETLRQSGEILSKLGDEVLTTNQYIAILEVSGAELTRTFGEFLTPVLEFTAIVLNALASNLNADMLRAFAAAVGTVAVAFGAAQIAVHGFTMALAINPVFLIITAIAASITALSAAYYGLIQATKESTAVTKLDTEAHDSHIKAYEADQAVLDRLTEAYNKTTEAKIKKIKADIAEAQFLFMTGRLNEDQKKGLDALNAELDELLGKNKKQIKNENELLKAYNSTIGARIKVIEAIIAQAQAKALSVGLTEEEIGGLIALIAKLNELKKTYSGVTKEAEHALEAFIEANNEQIDALMMGFQSLHNIFSELASAAMEAAEEHIDSINEIADAEIEIIRETAKATLAEEKKTRRWQRMTAKEQANYEKKLADEVAKNEAIVNAQRQADKEKVAKKANQLMQKQFRVEQAMNIVHAIMNTSEAVTKALPNVPLAVLVGILGAAEVAMIASQKAPVMQMAQGGLVGGRLHSQGGTMIEAERGEFVMRRSAVDTLGIETLNRLNEGGTAGSIVINFSGNVLSDDYIEDEAIPKIKEALRRGGDIGVG